jgi:hypothetical protein
MTLTGQNLEGETWDVRPITDEEYEMISECVDAQRSGAKHMLLLNGGHSGIAFPKGYCANRAMSYGGLRHEKTYEDILVDDEKYVAWVFDKMEEAHYESDYYYRFNRDYDKHDSAVWYFVNRIVDPTWWGDEE